MNNKEKKAIKKLKLLNTELYIDNCNLVNQDDLKIALNLIEKQDKDLETYKKIAEKLADILSLKPDEKSAKNYCNGEWSCLSKKKMTCKQCIIDWARKEVEK